MTQRITYSVKRIVAARQRRAASRAFPLHANRYTLTAGFTLIELLVTMGIMTLISGMILANHSKFGGSVLLQNLAYDVALTIREAQVYGISVRRFGASGFNAGYGVHFDTSNPATYVLFADAAGTPNGLYDSGELVNAMNIQRGYHIQQLCATNGSGVEDCTLTQLDILFVRPEPDAWISRNAASCLLSGAACQASARIVAASPQGATMGISVAANGQISIQQTVSGL